jgi:hypothetical protein
MFSTPLQGMSPLPPLPFCLSSFPFLSSQIVLLLLPFLQKKKKKKKKNVITLLQ